MRNAVADMLLAEPSRIATAQTKVQEHIEHQPLFAAERPIRFELLDQLDWPCEMASPSPLLTLMPSVGFLSYSSCSTAHLNRALAVFLSR
jgi:hypothetical protein